MCDVRGFAEAERRWLTPPEPKESAFDTALEELKGEVTDQLTSIGWAVESMTTKYKSNEIIERLEKIVGLIEKFNLEHEWEE